MTRQFAVLNPTDGQYAKFDTPEQAVDAAVTIAVSFYISQTHGQPFAQINVAEDGTETWSAPDGTPMLSPAQHQAEMEARMRYLDSFVNAGVIPVTQL